MRRPTTRINSISFGPLAVIATVRARAVTWAVACSIAAVLLGAGASATSAAPAGIDLFETDPESTIFRFIDAQTIPADFFAPGSQPFTGTVHLGGRQIGTHQDHDVGDADTIVRRTRDANLVPPFPATDTVPIEIVALNLQSVEPITVQVGTETQRWNVDASLSTSNPSQGQMTIVKTHDNGGTFSSQLVVMPIFTFTRVGDGAQKVLDLGEQAKLFPTMAGALTLQADNVPWRTGCTAPALAVTGLNDQFCPGLTTDGRKQLTLETALLAQHGIYPAQPRLEHFKCFKTLQAGRRFRPRSVQLTDQFGQRTTKVVRPIDICNPVRKEREAFLNKTDHLKCYQIAGGKFDQRNVAIRNQFGQTRLQVLKPKTLCLPSTKQIVRQIRKRPKLPTLAPLIDHFQCYAVKPADKFAVRKVHLTDQFGREYVRVFKLEQLCNPVQKNDTQIRHPVQHLVCYRIKDVRRQRFRQWLLQVNNQFGVELLLAIRPRSLCVPSLKLKV